MLLFILNLLTYIFLKVEAEFKTTANRNLNFTTTTTTTTTTAAPTSTTTTTTSNNNNNDDVAGMFCTVLEQEPSKYCSYLFST